jgi:hypothetical protein
MNTKMYMAASKQDWISPSSSTRSDVTSSRHALLKLSKPVEMRPPLAASP